MVRLLSAVAAASLLALPAGAMTFRVATASADGPSALVLAEGTIDAGDAARFAAFVAGVPNDHYEAPEWTVALAAPGGDPAEAILLAQQFRAAEVSTLVRAGATCSDACLLAFLGGTAHYVTASGVSRHLEPGARLGTGGASAETPGHATAAILDHAERMGDVDAGLLLGLFSRPRPGGEWIDTPREIGALGIWLAGEPPRPPRGWPLHACRLSVADMLQPLDPMGLDDRVVGPPEPMEHLEGFRRALLDARYPADGLHAGLRQPVLRLPPSAAIDLLAGQSILADQSPIGIWSVPLQRGAGFYYDICFGISNFRDVTTIVVSADGNAVTRGYGGTLAGFPPDSPLW